ncbi:hypothetical protein GSI_14917 [Ganoderma sinense ZZ0214-1]|uniref:Uncharacterized protein n=1 Tax=Ganoderma sinense ZZ0214-1 TaxID=1077348 RepID=A0A2G8RQ13_9APHY|nr:hypothetical protein GSI_14917 [Ganoderma sinense ZZ0214-1]
MQLSSGCRHSVRQLSTADADGFVPRSESESCAEQRPADVHGPHAAKIIVGPQTDVPAALGKFGGLFGQSVHGCIWHTATPLVRMDGLLAGWLLPLDLWTPSGNVPRNGFFSGTLARNVAPGNPGEAPPPRAQAGNGGPETGLRSLGVLSYIASPPGSESAIAILSVRPKPGSVL